MKISSTGEVYDGEWQLLREDPVAGIRKWIMAVDEDNFVVKTEWYKSEQFAADNKALYDASEGKKWGDGQVYARVPMHIRMGQLLEPTQQEDKKWLSRFYNDPDNRWMRTFKGNV